jgi:hypothetical protein
MRSRAARFGIAGPEEQPKGGRRISFHLGLSVSEILLTKPHIFPLASRTPVLGGTIPVYQTDQMVEP